ncbi:MAG: DPP IV N-terminal domain-containing protein [Steroidobacteraceae bacterium]
MRYTSLLLLPLIAMSSIHAAPLSVARMFAAPDLGGQHLREPKFSPDGHYVTYLQGKDTNKDQLDLWAFDTRSGKARLLVDSAAFITGPEQLSVEEEARRERQRTASLRGIVEYQFSSDGKKLLVPLGGDLYLYDLTARSDAVRRLTKTDSYETDARFSPHGNFVSFVRDQNLFIVALDGNKERALTTDGRGTVQNGVAEFVAQEEMGRNTGYWWSPDEKRIAFTRIDDAPVQEIDRLEINADTANVFRQRYPATGTANALVELKIVELDSGRVVPVDLGKEEHYLARVNWFPDSAHLAVQRQSRDQRRLDLLKVAADSGSHSLLLTETSDSWIELNDDLRFLEKRAAFIWGSRRSGFKHFYLHDLDGKLIRPLTAGAWMAVGEGEDGVVGIDEGKGLLYFMANEASPLERQLYATSLDTKDASKVQRISKEAGWHDVRLLPGAKGYLDQWSSPEQPPTTAIRDLQGKAQHWLIRNSLDASHPYQPFLADHVKEEYGSIQSADGQALYYRMLRPARTEPGKRYPVVIDTYGGPGVQYVHKDWMGGARAMQGYFRQVLAQHGYVVFTLDNRGSGYRGERFEAGIKNQLGKIEIADQLRGVDFLRQQSFVDSARIGMMGWSYGGYMTLMALTTTDVFRAGVSGAPVTDWSLYDTHYTERFLGTPAANATGYEVSGVLSHTQSLHGNLLLVHGMADDNVLFAHSTKLMQRLQSNSQSFELMTYPGGKHGLVRMAQMGRHYYEMVLKFFDEKLKGAH